MIFELGLFRTDMMHPKNIKWRGTHIEDYDVVRNLVHQYVEAINQHQPGDPKKAVEIILDVVKGEGVAAGKNIPDRLPLGTDVLAVMRKKAVANLTTCNEWEDVIRSTDYE